MGPQLNRCGNQFGRSAPREDLFASMGPQLNRCGNNRTTVEFAGGNEGFNGAATKPLRKLPIIRDLEKYMKELQWGRN